MTKKKEENIQNELPWTFQDTCSKIDDIARKLAKEIIKYEPLDLLQRAYWINATHQIQGLDKDYSEHDHYISAQILEFTQNYLVSLEPPGTEVLGYPYEACKAGLNRCGRLRIHSHDACFACTCPCHPARIVCCRYM